MLVVSSKAAGAVLELVLLAWLILEIRAHRASAERLREAQAQGEKVRVEDRRSRLLVWTCLVVSLITSAAVGSAGITRLPDWTFYLGIALMLIGIVLRQWSIAVLGRYFTPKVSVQAGQHVVDWGPYRLVRHPTYTGMLLTVAGFALAYQSWGALFVALVLCGSAISYRIRVEERVLTGALGNEYVDYSRRTKRLIPYIL